MCGWLSSTELLPEGELSSCSERARRVGSSQAFQSVLTHNLELLECEDMLRQLLSSNRCLSCSRFSLACGNTFVCWCAGTQPEK